MKSTKLLALFVLGTIIISSCKKDPYKTSHPDHGKIEFLGNWHTEAEGFSLPEQYTLYVDGQISTIPTTESVFPTLLKAGKYPVLVYSNSEKIIIEPGSSAVAEVKVDKDGFINANIGWLFAVSDTIWVNEDMVNAVSGEMKQLVRKLVLILELKELTPYASVIDGSAVLTGVASKLDYITDQVIPESEVKVRPEFKREGDTGEFIASLDLLGIIPGLAKQVLSFKLLYNKGGERKTIDVKIDLTSSMKTFNANKYIPMVLRLNMLNVEGGISKWEVIDSGSQVVFWPLDFTE